MASSTEAVSTPAIADHPVRAALLLGALGVVFGDIGTSPIYAFREALKAAGGPSEAPVFGVSGGPEGSKLPFGGRRFRRPLARFLGNCTGRCDQVRGFRHEGGQ